jgi:molecular chaperone GrpE (heat shock protein)
MNLESINKFKNRCFDDKYEYKNMEIGQFITELKNKQKEREPERLKEDAERKAKEKEEKEKQEKYIQDLKAQVERTDGLPPISKLREDYERKQEEEKTLKAQIQKEAERLTAQSRTV